MATREIRFLPVSLGMASLLAACGGSTTASNICPEGQVFTNAYGCVPSPNGGTPDAGFISGGGRDAGFLDPGTRDGGVTTGPGPDAGFGPRPDGGSTPPGEVTPGEAGRILLQGRAVLTMGGGAAYTPGEVYVENGTIQCVGGLGVCDSVSSGASVVNTGAVIAPGLVDAHNHVAYNWLPEWQTSPTWNDSVQWRGSSAYDQYIDPYSQNKTGEKFCAMLQWGEMRALVNGVTTIFGAPQSRTCIRWLIRNAELGSSYNGWSADRMRTNTLGISTVDQADATSLKNAMDAGDVTAYMIHLAEGISTRAHDEYVDLKNLGLLRSETVIIHGTALTASDFQEVANAGSKIVWSPSSNMALYNDTTNVQAALNAGLTVSLAPDWTCSGADDTLSELRYARAVLDSRWPGLVSDRDLVDMVTSIPAEQMAVDEYIGTLEVGKYADIVVLSAGQADAYNAVINAGPNHIDLVLIGGVPSYGRPEYMNALPDAPNSCHDFTACGASKRACWVDPPSGPTSPESVRQTIESFYSPGPQGFFDCP